MREPIKGVTIIGSKEKKIKIPLRYLFNLFTAKAISKPNTIIMGVTVNVKVNVKNIAL